MKNRGITVIETLIAILIMGIVMSLVFQAIQWTRRSFQVMGRTELYGQLKYTNLILQRRMQHATKFVSPTITIAEKNEARPGTQLVYLNQFNEIEVLFNTPTGLLTIYNTSRDEFIDLASNIKNLKVWHMKSGLIFYSFTMTKDDLDLQMQAYIRNNNQLMGVIN